MGYYLHSTKERLLDQHNNPQFMQMADASMVRCLAAQISAIWPIESKLLGNYQLPNAPRVLDLGCGTGEFAFRLQEHWADVQITGVDMIEPHLALARSRPWGQVQPDWLVADAMSLPLDDDMFDMVAARHLLQAVPDVDQVIGEMIRVTKPGGYLHFLAEDYGMLFFAPTDVDLDTFWREGAWKFGEATGTDLRSGRKIVSKLKRLPVSEIVLDYLRIDSLNTDVEILSAIFTAWRDGFAEAIVAHTQLKQDFVLQAFENMIRCARDPHGYALWLIPVISARVD